MSRKDEIYSPALKEKKITILTLDNKCHRLFTHTNEDQLIELPGEIDRVNRELMLQTMDICYDTLKTNETEIEETAKWVAAIRVELKKRLIRKQEMEQMNQELYSYMHDIFGAEVIEIFDMKYGNYSVQAEAFTAETVKK